METPVQIQFNIGNTITVPNDIRVLAKTFLGNNYAPASTSLLVDNTSDFLASRVGLIGTIGAENGEFVTISAITNATTLAVSALSFAHNRGEAVQMVDYNQFVVEKSATIDGSYTVFGTFNIQATQQNTDITDTAGLSTDYYRIKLKNSVSGLTSDYTTPVSSGAYDAESVGGTFDRVRTSFGVSVNDPIITTEFFIKSLNDARNAVRDMMPGFKQSWLEKFEHPIQLLAGRNYAILPDDYDMQYNNGQLLSVRYPRINGLSPYPLTYIDKRAWNTTAYSLKYTYTSGATSSGSSTLTVKNVGDFAPSGTIFISTNSIADGNILEVTYTGRNLSTNQFTGCVGITRNIPTNTQLFAFPTFSSATYYTVWFDDTLGKGIIVFNRPIPNVLHGKNIYIDYYKHMYPIRNINEVLPEPFANAYDYYLKYAIKYRRDNSTDITKDPDYLRFSNLVKGWIDNHYIGQGPRIITSG